MKKTNLEKYYSHPKLSSSINNLIKEVIDEDEAYVADELVELSEQILLELASIGISVYLSQPNQKEVFNDFIIELFTSKSNSYNSGPLYRWSAHMIRELSDPISKQIKSLFWEEEGLILNKDFEKLTELRNNVMHGFFVLPVERNREEANHLAKVLELLIQRNIFHIYSDMNYHFLDKNKDLTSFNGDWHIDEEQWIQYKECFDFGKLSSRIQYEVSPDFEIDQNKLVDKSKSDNIDFNIIEFITSNDKGALSYWVNPNEDSSIPYSTLISELNNREDIFLIFQKLDAQGINFTSDFFLERIIKKLAFSLNEKKYSKNKKRALSQLRKKCNLKPVFVIDSIHVSLFNSNHILRLANIFYENNILLIAFGVHHDWMDQFFNKSINKLKATKSPKKNEWKTIFENYLRFKGPDNNVADQKNDYNTLFKITSNLVEELNQKKIVIARRFSDENKYPIEFVHEAFSILNPFYQSNEQSFELDEIDELYDFPKKLTESSRVLFSVGRRDTKLEYQHKTLKL